MNSLRRLWRSWTDADAKLIKRQIADARKRHAPVRHLQAALTSLRHSQLAR